MTRDLNEAEIQTDGGSRPISDSAVESGEVRVHFRHLADRLVDFIENADGVVGCCAWLTHPHVLDALATRRCVSVLVNKEDFLRPDGDRRDARLRRRYSALPGIDRYEHTTPVNRLSYATDPESAAVRCVGVLNGSASNRPRLHHKFLIALKHVQMSDHPSGCVPDRWYAEAVWTGSLNPTANGAKSLENAVIIRNPIVANAYYEEWAEVFALSESLDWMQEWVAPEYRIGT